MRGRRTSAIPFAFIIIVAFIMVISRTAFDTSDQDLPVTRHLPAVPSKDLVETTHSMNRQEENVMRISKLKKSLPERLDVVQDLKPSPSAPPSPKGDIGSCYGLCSPNGEVPQADYVAAIVKKLMSKLTKSKVDTGTMPPQSQTEKRKPRHRHWTIAGATMFNMGTQPKLIFRLAMNGGANRTAIFKPKIYSRWKIDKPCSAFDRYNAELGAYYLRRTLRNFVKTTRVVGVRLDLKKDLWPVREAPLKNNTWITEDGTYCVQLECKYCYELVLCGDPNRKMSIDGSLSFWALRRLEKVENPWSSTCTQRVNAHWRHNAGLCPHLLSGNGFFSDRQNVLDAVGAGIFDFLIDNPDRHTFEYWQNETKKEFVLLDNGKAFPDPHHDDLTILAALFQCCMVRESTYSMLRHFSDTSILTASFKAWMASDPVYPFLGDGHVQAVARRIKKTLVVIELCIEKYGSSAVLLA